MYVPRVAYVYYLEDVSDPKEGYVGLALDPDARYDAHMRNVELGSQLWVHRWIRKSGPPRMRMLEITSDVLVAEREKAWIAGMRRKGYKLKNMTDGGDGQLNPVVDVRYRIGSSNRGARRTPERIAKWRGDKHDHNKGRKLTCEWRQRMRESHMWQWFTPTTKWDLARLVGEL